MSGPWTRIERALVLEPLLASRPEEMSLADRMTLHGVPGVSVAVIEDGCVAWSRAWGEREAGQGEALTSETMFQAGSISKAVTAMAVMRLVQEGTLNLDEDVNAYLQSWRVPANGSWQPRITLRQLLSHAAGTTIHGFFGYFPGEVLPTVPQILDGMPPANVRPVRVNLIPGTQFRYSGGGTTITQLILMDVTGEQFPKLMRRLILEPLGMDRSTFEPPESDVDPNRAAGHHLGPGVVRRRWRIYPELAAAGLWSTPSDLARLLVDVQRALVGEVGTLLRQDTARLMLSAAIEPHVGLGFFLTGEGASASFGHEGDTTGFQGGMLAFSSSGQGAVVMSNSDAAFTLRTDILRTLAIHYGWPQLAPERRDPIEPARATLEACAGAYAGERGIGVQITYSKGSLLLAILGQAPIPLVPLSPSRYVCDAVNAGITFLYDASGTVSGLSLRQDEHEIVAARIQNNPQHETMV